MSDLFPEAVGWGLSLPGAVLMTKAETIMRREEARAIQSHYDLGEVSASVLQDFERACRACYPGDPYSCYLSDVSAVAQHCAKYQVEESELFYGGSPGGGMVDTFCSGLHPIDWSDGWPA